MSMVIGRWKNKIKIIYKTTKLGRLGRHEGNQKYKKKKYEDGGKESFYIKIGAFLYFFHPPFLLFMSSRRRVKLKIKTLNSLAHPVTRREGALGTSRRAVDRLQEL